MNTLSQKLKNIYLLHPTYNNFIIFESLLPYLRKFLLDSIRLGEKYISPSDFALTYAIDYQFANEIFLSLANDSNVLNKYYHINCDHCSEYTITKDIYEITECVHCGHLNFTYNPDNFNFNFEDLKYLFIISESIRDELLNDLKERPSSSAESKEEGNQEASSVIPLPLIEKPSFPNTEDERQKLLEALGRAAKASI